MKTFSEFLEESYACLEEKTAAERMAAAYDGLKKEPRLIRHAMTSLIRSGKTGSGILRTANRFGKTSKQRARAKREKAIQDLRQYYPKTDYEKAEKKHEKLTALKMHGHHITPIHHSAALRADMTPEQWRERVRTDAEQGIYHGHHHKNLMGTITDETPEDKRGRGIKHKTGGAHELESKTKDLPPSIRYDIRLLSVAHKKDLRKQKEEREQANNQN
jgi:hypothetical protein